MPRHLPIPVIRSMTYEELERWWEVDFDVLASTAIAEATGPVHPTVTEALHSDDWLEKWADALYAAVAELASSVERMFYTRDERALSRKEQLGQVIQRQGHVNELVRAHQARESWTMITERLKDSRKAALAILSGHYAEEARQLREEQFRQRGLPMEGPFHKIRYRDRFEQIEDAVARGLVHVPVTTEVQELLDLPEWDFVNVVAADVKEQEEPLVELRHPLVLRRWSQALQTLHDQQQASEDTKRDISQALPGLKKQMKELRAMPSEAALKILYRRRFARHLSRRHRECMMHVRDMTRATSQRRKEAMQPWTDAVEVSREVLGERHPEELKALLAALDPFCVPGTTQFEQEAVGKWGPVPREVIPALKRALADGTWRGFNMDHPACP